MTSGSDSAAPDARDPVGPPGVLPSSVSRPAGLVLDPFRALRFTAPVERLPFLTSPPYDVIDDRGVAALEAADPTNVVRLILPRDGEQAQDRYQRAAATLRQWRASGVLALDPAPALYVYEQADPVTGAAQRGLVGALALSPAEDGIVLPHEDTMKGPVADRLALYTAVEADLEPIFLVYDGGGAASRAVADVDAREPLLDVLLPDGLRHRLWALTAPELLAEVARDLHDRTAVIADGHHRYATYLRRQAERHQAGAGAGPWDRGLTFLVDATAFGPQVHPIHRVVPGRDAVGLADAAAAGLAVRTLDGQPLDGALAELARAGQDGAAFLLASGDGRVLRLLSQPDAAQLEAAMPAERSAAWRALDVSVLHRYVVETLWNLPDTVETVTYEHDVAGALSRAAATAGTAVLLNATPVTAVTRVAGAGERMPRKSTLFTPKPRTGLVIRPYT
ncbi:MAG: hypothetical protein JWN57_2196 [Frankiales bacterium]|jgi:uncharacterized protein (DUF1015 family)|nr:hypothetical protein [Frankiales bacterium]